MSTLEDIRPKKLSKIIDLVSEAGIDVSDWANYNGKVPGANPRYCYNWAFSESGKATVVCLWHEMIKEAQGTLVRDLNLGELWPSLSGIRLKRAEEMDQILTATIASSTTLRIIVCGRSDSSKWKVTSRSLDPVEWKIADHDPTRKRFKLVRCHTNTSHLSDGQDSITVESYKAQLGAEIAMAKASSKEARLLRLAGAARKPSSVQVTAVVYTRNADVIVEVLERAEGKCEACFQDAPFIRAKDKTPYLEVHHVVPLSGGGEDVVENAVALCPNCHRQMHYG